jgi:peptidoglycan/xylan/chitin deacetylase (PgdA/CDA1 family)
MMRAPGGDERIYLRGEIGYPLMHWSLASGDSGNPNYKKIAQRVIGNFRDGEVVLMHDIKKYTVDAIEDILKWGIANGYTFAALDENSPTMHHGVNN